ncbi:hypothetical protein HJFPF1_08685 [Paramyrothecium foliicola]|nr:hypothetical protein HJFPF1_08685 [Paramyrothecium foliicola]
MVHIAPILGPSAWNLAEEFGRASQVSAIKVNPEIESSDSAQQWFALRLKGRAYGAVGVGDEIATRER